MIARTNKTLRSIVVAGAVLTAPAIAQAHPHAWIDVTVTLVFDGGGRVTALRQTWLFDAGYTAFATDGVTDPVLLMDLARGNLQNLTDFAYFTDVESDGVSIAFAAASALSSSVADGRLQMTFEVLFVNSVAVDVAPLTYAVYDPSYYVEVLHAEAPSAVRFEGAPAGCGHQLAGPAPDAETSLFASSLGPDQSGGNDLGRMFAETVTVLCETAP